MGRYSQARRRGSNCNEPGPTWNLPAPTVGQWSLFDDSGDTDSNASDPGNGADAYRLRWRLNSGAWDNTAIALTLDDTVFVFPTPAVGLVEAQIAWEITGVQESDWSDTKGYSVP